MSSSLLLLSQSHRAMQWGSDCDCCFLTCQSVQLAHLPTVDGSDNAGGRRNSISAPNQLAAESEDRECGLPTVTRLGPNDGRTLLPRISGKTDFRRKSQKTPNTYN